jgi:hypothetical protein
MLRLCRSDGFTAVKALTNDNSQRYKECGIPIDSRSCDRLVVNLAAG